MHTDPYLLSGDTGSHDYLSTAEVYFLWYFMQGSIMYPETRHQLVKSWGFCQRHMLGWLLIESAFYHHYFHGPSILLADLIERANDCFQFYGIPSLLALRLRSRGNCMMCSLGYNLNTEGYITADVLTKSKDISYLLEFARETEAYWSKSVCHKCTGGKEGEGILCRHHMMEELMHGQHSTLDRQALFIKYLNEQISFFAGTFQWENRGTETVECKAALISAAGWLKGWTEFINFYHKWG
jgi:hypothetical protein